jgi:hypothetical protein
MFLYPGYYPMTAYQARGDYGHEGIPFSFTPKLRLNEKELVFARLA